MGVTPVGAYLWDGAGVVSDNYHSGGAVLIIAATLDDARKAWEAHIPAKTDYARDEWLATVAGEPDRTWPLTGDHAPEVLVFEDAGCC